MANRPIHFEIGCEDTQRAVKFYTQLFGWEIKKWESDQFEYWTIATGDANSYGLNGALHPRNADFKGNTNSVVLTMGVEDVDATAKRVTELGGKVLMEPSDMPGVGRLAQCLDTEGNLFGLIKPNMTAMPNQ
jgi:uncharacterized protein